MAANLGPPPDIPNARSIFLPLIIVSPTDIVSCTDKFIELSVYDIRQQRTRLEKCDKLCEIAQRRANGLAAWRAGTPFGDPWSHITRAGEYPNEYVRKYGCDLPPSYGDKLNYVELLCGGVSTAGAAFVALARSPAHRILLFGENDFFLSQTRIGVAVAKDLESVYTWYWVIYLAECR
jgi:hypothetical protein